MGRTLHIEPFSGIAGDMFVAALLDLGADVPAFWDSLNSLPIREEFDARLETVQRSGIQARRFIVETHCHDHHSHSHGHSHGRRLDEIEAIISGASSITVKARDLSLAIFRNLAKAESKVHGKAIEHVHFHEVGAVDAIVDIVGASIAYDLLAVGSTTSEPPSLGGGTVKTAHGVLPVPAPATMELLTGLPSRRGPVEVELTTPTGAAILRTIVGAWTAPDGSVLSVGYGAGSKEFPSTPNVLRCSIMDAGGASDFLDDEVAVVECNLDDASGESLSHLGPKLFEIGALDYAVIPATMKKSRMGMIVQVIAPTSKRDAILDALLKETTTFGARWRIERRKVLRRRQIELETALGPVPVKVGLDAAGRVIKAKPEADVVSRLARDNGESYIETSRTISDTLSKWINDHGN